MNYPTLSVAIASAPTDWLAVWSAMFAAFFGAAAAFALNLGLERLHERRRRLDAINSGIYGLVLTMGSLVNLKQQFLTNHKTEFDRITSLLSQIHTGLNDEERALVGRQVNAILLGISRLDSTLDGAFIVWQQAEFPMMPKPNDFHFTLDENAELVRILHVADLEVTQVSKRIAERNEFWGKNIQLDFNSGFDKDKHLTFMFQMLSFRSVLAQHTDTALVMMNEALDQLDNYRTKRLKKKRGPLRLLYQAFIGKETWASYRPSKVMTAAIPNREEYKAIIGEPVETAQI